MEGHSDSHRAEFKQMGKSPLVCDCFTVIIFTFLGFGFLHLFTGWPYPASEFQTNLWNNCQFQSLSPVNIGTLTVPQEPSSSGCLTLRIKDISNQTWERIWNAFVSDVLDLTCTSRIVSEIFWSF